MEHRFEPSEKIAEHFSSSLPWVYRNFAKRADSKLDENGRKVYDLTRALELFAKESCCEIYSVPCAGPWLSPNHYKPSKRPRRVRIKMSDRLRERIVNGEPLWRLDEIAYVKCDTDVREMAYRYVYANAWYALVYGGKTLYISREEKPKHVAPAIEALAGAHAVKYSRGAKKKRDAINALLDAPLP